MWFGIGKMCLENKYNQNINVPNHYSRTVKMSARDREIESELRALI